MKLVMPSSVRAATALACMGELPPLLVRRMGHFLAQAKGETPMASGKLVPMVTMAVAAVMSPTFSPNFLATR